MIINVKDFDYSICKDIKVQKRKKGNPAIAKNHRADYLNIVCAFDIETSRLPDIEQSIMYVWQFQFGLDYTVIGRTWADYLEFLYGLMNNLPSESCLVVFVHNLSYEFQYLSGIYDFTPDEVFSVQPRKVLKCTMFDKRIEYRCSYIHSNLTLKQFTSKMQVKHVKLDDYDYEGIRYPWTQLSDEELSYCQNDVLGLVEAIQKEMIMDGDNLYTLPLTSTGYVRRDVKRAMQKISHMFVKNIVPDWNCYVLLHEAFRGGNTHANRYYANMALEQVFSADRSSSYPEVLCNKEFPIKPFFHRGAMDAEELRESVIKKRHKAVLMRCALSNIRLRYKFWGCPYLAKNKCRDIRNGDYDNGRILSADYLETTITDIDLSILDEEYIFDLEPLDVYYSSYGKLPDVLKNVIIHYYIQKTSLKGVEGQEVYYFKSKNKLNSIYGMMATDPVKINILYQDGVFVDDADADPLALLAASNKKAFVAYQWGVWTCAWARRELEDGLKLAGDGFVYADTDSVKYLDPIDWNVYNEPKICESIKNDAYATDPAGVTHYMGVFEQEETYTEFSTLGAKKYVGRHADGKLEVTIAGVNKKLGGAELEKYGGISAFKDGFTFLAAGGLEALYNDKPPMPSITVDGHKLDITKNVCLKPSTYTLGLTGEYERLLNLSSHEIDRIFRRWYTV